MKRNDPCPCGSGRKHKHCCLGRAAREAVTWKHASDRDVALMAKAKAEGISVSELRAEFADARIRARTSKIKRSTAMFGVYAALYGGTKA